MAAIGGERRAWVLTPFERSSWRHAAIQLSTSVVPFVACWYGMYRSLEVGYWLTLLLAVPTAGFLTRCFMILHDCAHRSFVPSVLGNDVLGSALGIVTLTPFDYWRRTHAVHHAGFGNLDRRGLGDLWLLTVKEYREQPAWMRFYYRLYRHPLVLFGIGPMYQFVLKHRLPVNAPLSWRRAWASVAATNVAWALILAGAHQTIGIGTFVLVHLPVCVLTYTAGVWLFFVQHQFEDTYWRRAPEWRFSAAGSEGSSYYVLPAVLRWFTCDIGLHHVHHLAPRIPNYRLSRCLQANPELETMGRLTLGESLRCLRLALWDEQHQSMVGFRDIRV